MLIIWFYFSILFMMLSMSIFFFSFYFFVDLSVIFIEFNLMYLNGLPIIYLVMIDWLSLIFMSVVFFISSMVLIYSYNYMSGDVGMNKFIWLIFLFVISMALMIMSPNLLSIMLGWDGLGLVSYMLVIYYNSNKSFNCGMLTILTNRLGDVAMLLSLAWCMNYGSMNFFYLMNMEKEVKILFFLIMLAAMTKSAQIPFSAWLPAAMAAPTPVSSLVHSSTLVTAGVYLLIRFHELIHFNYFLLVVSLTTLLMSGFSANFEFDLKKTIALSTLSQLGMMMLMLSLGCYEIAFFHLISHAMFKSLLFLCAGHYIHNKNNWQDIRFLSSSMNDSPIISIFFFYSSLSLCGLPFLSGFYSKDLIIELMFMENTSMMIYIMIIISIMLTLSYSFRLVFFLFLNKSNSILKNNLTESLYMVYPMFFLFFFSVSVGSFFALSFFPLNFISLNTVSKLSIIILLILSFFMSWVSLMTVESKIGLMWWSYINMWNLPFLSLFYSVNALGHGFKFMKLFDHMWLEKITGSGGYNYLSKFSLGLDKGNLMNFKIYIFFFFYFCLIFLMY